MNETYQPVSGVYLQNRCPTCGAYYMWPERSFPSEHCTHVEFKLHSYDNVHYQVKMFVLKWPESDQSILEKINAHLDCINSVVSYWYQNR